jgi:hypothetical protein
MSGRAKFVTTVFFGAVMAAIIYPICGHYGMASMDFLNRMGSMICRRAVINMLGGVAASWPLQCLDRVWEISEQGHRMRSRTQHGIDAIGVYSLGWLVRTERKRTFSFRDVAGNSGTIC